MKLVWYMGCVSHIGEMGCVAHVGEVIKANATQVGKPEGKRSLRRTRLKLYDRAYNIAVRKWY